MNSQEEETKRTYNAISQSWDKKRQKVWNPVHKFLQKISQKSMKKFLDAGCGNGRFSILAKSLGFSHKNIHACDFSKEQVKICKKKGFNTTLCDIRDLTFKDNFFDTIICIATLHHILEKREQLLALKELKRALKQNGTLLLSTWFPTKKQLKKGKFTFSREDNKGITNVTYTINEEKKHNRHYYLFKEDEILELCADANFKLIHKNYTQGNLYLTLKK